MEYDVIVIGGGIIGSSITYHLSKSGIGKVCLIERNEIGSGSTSYAASLMTQVRSKPNLVPLVQETYRDIAELSKDYHMDLNFKVNGTLYVSSSQDPDSFSNLVEIAERYGIPYSYPENNVQKMVPWLNNSMVCQSLYIQSDGHLEATILADAYANASKSNGAKILTGTEVVSVIVEKGIIAGVQTEREVISAPIVIDAAGVWSNLLSTPLGVNLPMSPVRSIYWITTFDHSLFPKDHPSVIIPEAKVYTRPESGGLVFGIRDSESLAFNPKDISSSLMDGKFIDEQSHWDILMREGRELIKFFPQLDDVGIRHCIANICSYTIDGQLIIGESVGVKGFYAATGCSGGGVALAGGFGKIISRMLLQESEVNSVYKDLAIERLNIDPFDLDFLLQCSKTRSNKRDG